MEIWQILIVTAFFSWNFTVLALPLLRRYSVSTPRLNRLEKGQIPGGGGIITLAVTGVAWLAVSRPFLPVEALKWLLAAAFLLATVSWLDDKRHVHWRWRLLLHLTLTGLGSLALAHMFNGLLLANVVFALFGGWVPMWLDVAFAALFWTAILNFLNFIDGSDGAFASQALAITLGVGLLAGDELATAGFIAAAALLGFLALNFPPAKVFCGNSGVAPLGYLYGLLLLVTAAKGLLVCHPDFARLPFALERLIAKIKTLLAKKSPWEASRRFNLIHILALSGGSHSRILLALSAFAVALVALTLLAAAFRNPFWQLAVVTAAWGGCLFAVLSLHKSKPSKKAKQPSEKTKLVPIKRALVSVWNKKGLARLAKTLDRFGVEIIASGGTAEAVSKLGAQVRDVSSVTDFPEIFGGRVKTLHPRIHGGILMRRNNVEDNRQANIHKIKPFDLVVVDLYPFADFANKGLSDERMAEYIDIGGPAMLRAAAKNYRFVTVVSSATDQLSLEESMLQHDGKTSLSLRRVLAARAFRMLRSYDEKVATWLESGGKRGAGLDSAGLDSVWRTHPRLKTGLRYGENPHQRAELYEVGDEFGLARAEQLQGKPPSYNNYQDGDAALRLAADLAGLGRAAVALIKHATPCAAAVAGNAAAAWDKAYAADNESAFGGICAFTKPVDAATAERLAQLFLEVVIAPDFSEDGRKILAAKKNLRLFKIKIETARSVIPPLEAKRISGGWLVQETDREKAGSVASFKPKVAGRVKPKKSSAKDLQLAWTVAKHARSNAVVISKGMATRGIGSGQTSRVEATRQALKGSDCRGAAAASDGFFPFPDAVKMLAEAGVKAVIQPGGSINDRQVIAAADSAEMAMLFSGIRHFKH